MHTLLLADDSVTIQRVIELTFADEDIRVVSVGDGRRARQWLERETPDVVLVDVAAPDVDGYALSTFIRQSARLKHLPVLLLAGVFEAVDEVKAKEAGASGVLVKPFEPEDLVARVRALIDSAGHLDADEAAAGPPRAVLSHEAEPSNVVTPFPAAPRLASMHAVPAPVPSPPTFEATPERPLRETQSAALSGDRRDPALPSRVALANAFSALLAAEQAMPPPAPAAPVLTDAMVEEAVRRVLVRMTDNIVRRVVVETAERLIREEIEKIKSSSE
jgi:CheY-like chemotaxis protein